jgi:hypothetical protein
MRQHGCPTIQRPSHNSNPQQKEAPIGLHIGKQAFRFAKYLIMGQVLHSVVASDFLENNKI